jgi:hypothetical protein
MTTMQGHGNSPAWVKAEAERLHPLDLAARVKWMIDMAYASASEDDRHEILTEVRRIRNGTPR